MSQRKAKRARQQERAAGRPRRAEIAAITGADSAGDTSTRPSAMSPTRTRKYGASMESEGFQNVGSARIEAS